MFVELTKTRSFLFSFIKSSVFALNFVVLLLFLILIVGAQVGKERSTLVNMPPKGSAEVMIVEKSEEVLGEVDEIVGKVVGAPVPLVEQEKRAVKQEDPKTDSSTEVLGEKTDESLCESVKEDWQMIPDPSHSGQYIICNTKSEKMTTVDELNSAQNSYRQRHGLNSLNINSGLCSVAARRAEEVSKNFSHSGFESAVKGSGLGKSSYGENIASGPLSGVHFIEWSWDKSPGHRSNMLGDWTDGCGGVSGKYAVFLFAK